MIGFIIGSLLATIIIGPAAYVAGRARGAFVAARRAIDAARLVVDHADDLRAAAARAWAWADTRRHGGRVAPVEDEFPHPF